MFSRMFLEPNVLKCALYALRTCADGNAESHPHIKKLVYESIYMNHCFEATDDIDTAVKSIEDIRQVLKQGSFNLRKWITTDHRSLQTIPEEHISITVDEIEDPKIFKRNLGISWRVSNDTLSFTTDKLHELAQKKPTQRNLRRAASSIFDAIGIAASITIRIRIIQQAILRKVMKWDDQITRKMIPDFFELLRTRETVYRQ